MLCFLFVYIFKYPILHASKLCRIISVLENLGLCDDAGQCACTIETMIPLPTFSFNHHMKIPRLLGSILSSCDAWSTGTPNSSAFLIPSIPHFHGRVHNLTIPERTSLSLRSFSVRKNFKALLLSAFPAISSLEQIIVQNHRVMWSRFWNRYIDLLFLHLNRTSRK